MKLSVTNLDFQFKDRYIFKEASISFGENKISFIMAPNGAGKTTLIKIFLRMLKTKAETVENSELNKDIFVLFDDLGLYKNLTGMDNIRLFTDFKYSKKEIEEKAQKYLSKQRLNKHVSSYSLGEGKKVSLILWELMDSPIAIMDEVTNGLDYESLIILKKQLVAAKNGKIILLTGHQFDFYKEIIDDLYIIKDEKLLKVEKGDLEKIYEKNFKEGTFLSD